MKKLALVLAFALSACATTVAPRPQTPSGAGAPRGALDLGDWRRASQGVVAARFSETVSERYAAGSPVAQARSDLERNSFSCAPGQGGRGAAPAQVCQRSMRANDCQHIWRVHLYAERAGLARTRALYDRTCGDDRLLGG